MPLDYTNQIHRITDYMHILSYTTGLYNAYVLYDYYMHMIDIYWFILTVIQRDFHSVVDSFCDSFIAALLLLPL